MRDRRKAADDVIRARVKQRVAQGLKPLQAKQAARRLALTQREQRMLLTQAAERLALAAAQHAESKRAFTGAAMLVFSLIERIPGLRSVLAPILRNPALNPNERHAQSRDALRRRHEREKALRTAPQGFPAPARGARDALAARRPHPQAADRGAPARAEVRRAL